MYGEYTTYHSENVNRIMYTYGCVMFFFLLMTILDLKTVDLIFCLTMNIVTLKYIVGKNFIF